MHPHLAKRPLLSLGLIVMTGAGAQNALAHYANTYDQLKQALMDGRRVSAVFDFSRCQPCLPHQAGLAIQEFMIVHEKSDGPEKEYIAFSSTHSTVHTDQNVAYEFIRYTVSPETASVVTTDTIAGKSARVDMSAYGWNAGQTQAKFMVASSCSMGEGATFTW